MLRQQFAHHGNKNFTTNPHESWLSIYMTFSLQSVHASALAVAWGSGKIQKFMCSSPKLQCGCRACLGFFWWLHPEMSKHQVLLASLCWYVGLCQVVITQDLSQWIVLFLLLEVAGLSWKRCCYQNKALLQSWWCQWGLAWRHWGRGLPPQLFWRAKSFYATSCGSHQ